MAWLVVLHDDFDAEYEVLPESVREELAARLHVVAQFGPNLGRPTVDTLEGSKYPNMKELRFRLDGLWRFAFAFDRERQAVILCGGDKKGENQKRFYRRLIETADGRFEAHLNGSRRAAGGKK